VSNNRSAPLAVALIRDLGSILSSPLLEEADLRNYSRWRIGGRAKLVVEPATVEEAAAVFRRIAHESIPKLVIGDGSNLLFDDGGFDGIIVRIGPQLSRFRRVGRRVKVEAGLWVPCFVRMLGRCGLSGLEHAIGIPGSLGGLVYMNGGSQRKGVGGNITTVSGCDWNGEPFERSHEECAFQYRSSSLQSESLIVLDVDFEFAEAEPSAMRREMLSILADRRRKFPKNLPNCGSVFLSNPTMYSVIGPPGAAIERVGLKGCRRGGAQISALHANFIVNLGGASSRDVLNLIHLARSNVYDSTGFWMDCEIRHVAPDGEIRQAHEPAAEAAEGLMLQKSYL
jgi:UDP-N-acetylmuramate dehydrogenase